MPKIFSLLKIKFANLYSSPLQLALLLAAWFGLAIRAFYCFGSNPLDFLGICDSQRHYANAIHLFQRPYSFLDQIGYQLWLSGMFSLFGLSKLAVATFTACLSLTVPYIWLLWLREITPSKTAQLAGFAAIALLLPWITIYAFFMTETLLIPVLGLAFWLTWRAKRKGSYAAVALAALAWALAVNVKVIILPEAFMALAWLFYHIARSGSRRSVALQLASAGIILICGHLITPVLNMVGFGTTWLYPPGGIHSFANRAFLVSGAQHYKLEIPGPKDKYFNSGAFDAGALNNPDELIPFIHWSHRRTGCVTVSVPRNRGMMLAAPDIEPYRALRPEYMKTQPWFIWENTAAFFFACEWPDCSERDFLQSLQTYTRWLWAPIFLFTIMLAAIRRRCNTIVGISVLTALCFCLQDWGPVSGRYRKPWEGVAIVALISMLSEAKSTTKQSTLQKDAAPE